MQKEENYANSTQFPAMLFYCAFSQTAGKS